MDLSNILKQLREQRDALNESILSLERIVAGSGPRRGRPPKWMAAAREVEAPKLRGRPLGKGKKPAAVKV
jgi:hypothetical protein